VASSNSGRRPRAVVIPRRAVVGDATHAAEAIELNATYWRKHGSSGGCTYGPTTQLQGADRTCQRPHVSSVRMASLAEVTPLDGVNFIIYIKLWGEVQIFLSLKHNLLQQFPYSPSQLVSPTMPHHPLILLPKSSNFRLPPCIRGSRNGMAQGQPRQPRQTQIHPPHTRNPPRSRQTLSSKP
jgi:hypothetical protein